MDEIEVRIIELEPMIVASAHAFGESPELIAIEKILAWAESNGLQGEMENHRFFGFNNPNPSPASPNYGYDFWMTVDPSVITEGEINLLELPGGLYVVTKCMGVSTITETWHKLVEWREDSKYTPGEHQWLEEHLNPLEPDFEKYEFDLHLPIME